MGSLVRQKARKRMSDNQEKQTILVVDDQESDRWSMCRLLEQQGYAVLEAAHDQEAVSVHERHQGKIKMLLTAIALPGANGYELARILLRIDPDLKVLFVSGPTGAKVSRFYNMPASGPHLLDKPVQPEELLNRVRDAIHSPNLGLYGQGAE